MNLNKTIHAFLLVGLLITSSTNAKQKHGVSYDLEWFVPDNVVYVSGDAEVVESVRKDLIKVFRNHEKRLYKLAKKKSGYFFLGPLLSARINDANPQKAIELKTVGYRIELAEDVVTQFDGLLAKTNKEKKLLSQLLSNLIGDSESIKLRKLTPYELAFMWYFISWDIKEPVFVLETDEQEYLVDMGGMDDEQLWIEVLSNPCYRFGFDDIVSSCMCFDVMFQNKSWSAGFLEKTQQCHANGVTVFSPENQEVVTHSQPVSLEAVILTDGEHLIGDNIETNIMSDWIKSLEHELNEEVSTGQDGGIAIKVTAQTSGKPQYEMQYRDNVNEDWLNRVHERLQDFEPILAKQVAVTFELIFTVKSPE